MTTFNINNTYQKDLFERTITNYLEEWRNLTEFNRFMGSSADNPIQVKVLKNGDGDTVVFPYEQTGKPKIVEGANQLSGHETGLTIVSDSLVVNDFRFATAIINERKQALQVDYPFYQRVKRNLLRQAEEVYLKRIISTFALGLANIRINRGESQEYEYEALPNIMLNAKLDTLNEGVSRSRIVIGNNYYATQATIGDALQVGNLPVADHKLSVEHIRQVVRLARTGRSKTIVGGEQFTSKEAPVVPYRKTREDGFQDITYLYLISPDDYSELVKDPEWRAQTQRGVIAGSMQPSILGGSNVWRGTVEGAMVLEIPEFDNLIVTNAAGNRYGYSVLLGASAIGFGMAGKPTFVEELRDYKMQYGLAHWEISGMKVLKYPSKSIGVFGNNTNMVEYGMVHSFTTLS